MRRISIRRTLAVAGLTAVVSAASLAAPADAAILTGNTNFKMISGLSRVRNCALGDLLSNASSTWKLNSNGAVSVLFGGASKSTCLSLYTPGASAANAVLSYERADNTTIAQRVVNCSETAIVLPFHCQFPASADFTSNDLRKVKITLTQTNPAAPPSTTTILPPAAITESDSFKMLSGLSRIRNCAVGDLESQASALWTYRASGQNSITMSGPGHVCMSMFRPGNSTATAVVLYKNAAGSVLTSRTVTCVDTNKLAPFHCPFPATTDLTLSGLTQVTINFTQTSPAAGTSSTTLQLGD